MRHPYREPARLGGVRRPDRGKWTPGLEAVSVLVLSAIVEVVVFAVDSDTTYYNGLLAGDAVLFLWTMSVFLRGS